MQNQITRTILLTITRELVVMTHKNNFKKSQINTGESQYCSDKVNGQKLLMIEEAMTHEYDID